MARRPGPARLRAKREGTPHTHRRFRRGPDRAAAPQLKLLYFRGPERWTGLGQDQTESEPHTERASKSLCPPHPRARSEDGHGRTECDGPAPRSCLGCGGRELTAGLPASLHPGQVLQRLSVAELGRGCFFPVLFVLLMWTLLKFASNLLQHGSFHVFGLLWLQACGILAPRPGFEPAAPALEAQS